MNILVYVVNRKNCESVSLLCQSRKLWELRNPFFSFEWIKISYFFVVTIYRDSVKLFLLCLFKRTPSTSLFHSKNNSCLNYYNIGKPLFNNRIMIIIRTSSKSMVQRIYRWLEDITRITTVKYRKKMKDEEQNLKKSHT